MLKRSIRCHIDATIRGIGAESCAPLCSIIRIHGGNGLRAHRIRPGQTDRCRSAGPQSARDPLLRSRARRRRERGHRQAEAKSTCEKNDAFFPSFARYLLKAGMAGGGGGGRGP